MNWSSSGFRVVRSHSAVALVFCSWMPTGMARSHTPVPPHALETHHTLVFALLLLAPLEIWENLGILQKKKKYFDYSE